MIQLTPWQYGVVFGICITYIFQITLKFCIFLYKAMMRAMPIEMKEVFKGIKEYIINS